MKVLSCTSMFEDHYLPQTLLEKSGAEYYYRQNNRRVKCYVLPCSNNGLELFQSIKLFEMHSLYGTHYRRRNAPFFSLEFIQEGQMYVKQNDNAYLLEGGDIFLMHPFSNAEYMIQKGDYCIKTSIAISGLLLADYLYKTGLNRIDVLSHTDNSGYKEFFVCCKELAEQSGLIAWQANSRLTYRLLQRLVSPFENIYSTSKIQVAVDYIEKNYRMPINLNYLATLCGISQTHLIRCFKKSCGISPYQLLYKIRMQNAAKLLITEPELSIKEISFMVGYTSPLNFSAGFRKHFSLSPSNYRINQSHPS